MVPKFDRVFGFEITDSDDVVVPFTFDFKYGKGEVFLGKIEERDYLKNESLSCTIRMSEKDFHGLLDKNLGVKEALFKSKIRISGGLSGATNAWDLVNNFLKPYMIDTWSESEAERIELYQAKKEEDRKNDLDSTGAMEKVEDTRELDLELQAAVHRIDQDIAAVE